MGHSKGILRRNSGNAKSRQFQKNNFLFKGAVEKVEQLSKLASTFNKSFASGREQTVLSMQQQTTQR